MFNFLIALMHQLLEFLTNINPTVRAAIAVSLGAIPGALCRYYLSLYFGQWLGNNFPFGTFFVNLTGAVLMGVFITLTPERSIATELRLLIAVGFLGSYTTFSTYALDTVSLIQQGNLIFALVYWAGSALLGIFGIVLGRLLTQRFIH
jgi:CrcB protein